MNILVRTPNWLGDMVMGFAFFEQLRKEYAEAHITVIVKKGLEPIMEFYPVDEVVSFSKKEFGGFWGLRRFGKSLKRKRSYDLFFSMPDSFSAALMGFFAGAKKRVGFKREQRSILLTNHYTLPYELHYVERYTKLLEDFTSKKYKELHTVFPETEVTTAIELSSNKPLVLLNFLANAPSRTLSIEKSVAIYEYINKHSDVNFVVSGVPSAKEYVLNFLDKINSPDNVINLTGKTKLSDFIAVLRQCAVVLTVDSGPAHLSNALGRPTVALLGAGDPSLIRPWNTKDRTIIRLEEPLPCMPCRQNHCKLGTVECLEKLNVVRIGEAVLGYL